MKNILHTIAADDTGKLIHANKAEKGNKFYCTLCNSELILRKSGKVGKGTKRPHFAHRKLTPNCTPESVLHFTFKTLLSEKLRGYIKEKVPLPFSWKCLYCAELHSGNLLKKAKFVELEHNLKSCIPDIALLDKNQVVFAAIEVVVTHKPEESTLKYYQENGITLVQIDLKTDKDLEDIDGRIANPDKVLICPNPKCDSCGHFQSKKIMTIIDGPCRKCDSTIKIASISTSTHSLVEGISTHLSPSAFTPKEIEFAKSKGVYLKNSYSRSLHESYVANSCSNCGSFVGNFYLFSEYISPAYYGEFPFEKFDIGFHCDHCNNEEDY